MGLTPEQVLEMLNQDGAVKASQRRKSRAQAGRRFGQSQDSRAEGRAAQREAQRERARRRRDPRALELAREEMLAGLSPEELAGRKGEIEQMLADAGRRLNDPFASDDDLKEISANQAARGVDASVVGEMQDDLQNFGGFNNAGQGGVSNEKQAEDERDRARLSAAERSLDPYEGFGTATRPDISTPEGLAQYEQLLRRRGSNDDAIAFRIGKLREQGIFDPIGEELKDRDFRAQRPQKFARKAIRNEYGGDIFYKKNPRERLLSVEFANPANPDEEFVVVSRKVGKNGNFEEGLIQTPGGGVQVLNSDEEFEAAIAQARNLKSADGSGFAESKSVFRNEGEWAAASKKGTGAKIRRFEPTMRAQRDNERDFANDPGAFQDSLVALRGAVERGEISVDDVVNPEGLSPNRVFRPQDETAADYPAGLGSFGIGERAEPVRVGDLLTQLERQQPVRFDSQGVPIGEPSPRVAREAERSIAAQLFEGNRQEAAGLLPQQVVDQRLAELSRTVDSNQAARISGMSPATRRQREAQAAAGQSVVAGLSPDEAVRQRRIDQILRGDGFGNVTTADAQDAFGTVAARRADNARAYIDRNIQVDGAGAIDQAQPLQISGVRADGTPEYGFGTAEERYPGYIVDQQRMSIKGSPVPMSVQSKDPNSLIREAVAGRVGVDVEGPLNPNGSNYVDSRGREIGVAPTPTSLDEMGIPSSARDAANWVGANFQSEYASRGTQERRELNPIPLSNILNDVSTKLRAKGALAPDAPNISNIQQFGDAVAQIQGSSPVQMKDQAGRVIRELSPFDDALQNKLRIRGEDANQLAQALFLVDMGGRGQSDAATQAKARFEAGGGFIRPDSPVFEREDLEKGIQRAGRQDMYDNMGAMALRNDLTSVRDQFLGMNPSQQLSPEMAEGLQPFIRNYQAFGVKQNPNANRPQDGFTPDLSTPAGRRHLQNIMKKDKKNFAVGNELRRRFGRKGDKEIAPAFRQIDPRARVISARDELLEAIDNPSVGINPDNELLPLMKDLDVDLETTGGRERLRQEVNGIAQASIALDLDVDSSWVGKAKQALVGAAADDIGEGGRGARNGLIEIRPDIQYDPEMQARYAEGFRREGMGPEAATPAQIGASLTGFNPAEAAGMTSAQRGQAQQAFLQNVGGQDPARQYSPFVTSTAQQTAPVAQGLSVEGLVQREQALRDWAQGLPASPVRGGRADGQFSFIPPEVFQQANAGGVRPGQAMVFGQGRNNMGESFANQADRPVIASGDAQERMLLGLGETGLGPAQREALARGDDPGIQLSGPRAQVARAQFQRDQIQAPAGMYPPPGLVSEAPQRGFIDTRVAPDALVIGGRTPTNLQGRIGLNSADPLIEASAARLGLPARQPAAVIPTSVSNATTSASNLNAPSGGNTTTTPERVRYEDFQRPGQPGQLRGNVGTERMFPGAQLIRQPSSAIEYETQIRLQRDMPAAEEESIRREVATQVASANAESRADAPTPVTPDDQPARQKLAIAASELKKPEATEAQRAKTTATFADGSPTPDSTIAKEGQKRSTKNKEGIMSKIRESFGNAARSPAGRRFGKGAAIAGATAGTIGVANSIASERQRREEEERSSALGSAVGSYL